MIDPSLPRNSKGAPIQGWKSEPPPPEPWFEGVRQCSRKAKGRPGQRCPNEALPNLKICGFHYSASVGGRQVTSGLYMQQFTNPVLRERFKHIHDDPDLLAIRAEIAAARTLLEEAIERRDPADAAAIDKLVRLLEVVTKMVQRDHDIAAIKRLSWDLVEIRQKAVMLAHGINQILKDFPFQRAALVEYCTAIFADAGVAADAEHNLMMLETGDARAANP